MSLFSMLHWCSSVFKKLIVILDLVRYSILFTSVVNQRSPKMVNRFVVGKSVCPYDNTEPISTRIYWINSLDEQGYKIQTTKARFQYRPKFLWSSCCFEHSIAHHIYPTCIILIIRSHLKSPQKTKQKRGRWSSLAT